MHAFESEEAYKAGMQQKQPKACDFELPDTVLLMSADGQKFTVDGRAVVASVTLRDLFKNVEVDPSNMYVPLPDVTGAVLAKVLEWCEHHKNDEVLLEEDRNEEEKGDGGEKSERKTDISEWDREFIRSLDQGFLFEIMLAANYLEIKALLQTCCKSVAETMKGKSAAEIRRVFNIEADFTPEEEEQLRREAEWMTD